MIRCPRSLANERMRQTGTFYIILTSEVPERQHKVRTSAGCHEPPPAQGGGGLVVKELRHNVNAENKAPENKNSL